MDQKVLTEREAGPEELAELILKEERWRQVLSSLVVCFFARGIYGPDTVLRALRSSGFELKAAELPELGRRIYTEKYRFKRREGFDLGTLRIPGRIHRTPSPSVLITEQYLRQALAAVRERVEAGL